MNDKFFKAVQSGGKDSATVIMEEITKDRSLLTQAGPGGWPALHLAAYFGKLECVTELLKAGADLELRSLNETCNTPLHAAVAGRQVDAVKLLLARGANLKATYAQGTHAIHEASFLGHIDMVKTLLDLGSELNLRTEAGETPLSIAQKRGHNELVEFLKGGKN